MNPTFLVLEIGATVFFLGAAWAALRRGRLPFLELVSAAVFGILLEEGDQLIFETYHYSTDWVLTIDRAPVVIGLTWALIIAGAMRLTDALGVRRRYAPFVDSLLAISLDLAFDAIAIRMGLWTWRDIGPTDGWFGVPAGNFYAWLFVTLGFSMVTRWIRDASRGRPAREWWQLAAPFPAYAVLLLGLVPFIILKPMVDSAPGGGLTLFAITLAAFCVVAAWGVWGPDRIAPDGQGTAILDLRLAIFTRITIHLFFLGALLYMGLATELPVLLLVSLLLLVAELPLAALVRARLAPAADSPRTERALAEALD
jgi:Carotenoid biosynthesis protein